MLAKLALVRRLYAAGYERPVIIDLFKFIDWLMRLPEDLELQLRDAYQQFEQEQQMPYVTSVERIGLEKGRKEGQLLRGLNDTALIQHVFERIKDAAQLIELRCIYAEPSSSEA